MEEKNRAGYWTANEDELVQEWAERLGWTAGQVASSLAHQAQIHLESTGAMDVDDIIADWMVDAERWENEEGEW